MSVLGLSFPSSITPSPPIRGYGNPSTNGRAGLLGQEYTDLNSARLYMKGDPSLRELGWFPIGSATGNATVLYGTVSQVAPIGVVVQSGPAVWYGTNGSIWVKTDPGNDFLNWYPLTTTRLPSIINGDPILPGFTIGGIDAGASYDLSASSLPNSQGQKLSWSFPSKWVDGITTVPGTGTNAGTTHWPVYSLTIQRSPSSSNIPWSGTPFAINFPFLFVQQSVPLATRTNPDWVNIAQWTNTSVDALLALLRDPSNSGRASYIDPTAPNPTWNYRIIMQMGLFTIAGRDLAGELDWNVVQVNGATSGTLEWLRTGSSVAGGNAADPLVAFESTGNAYWGIAFTGTMDFGFGNVSSTSSQTSSFIGKYNQQGNPIWSRTLLSSGTVSIKGMAVDSQSGLYVIGSFQSSVDFGGTTLTSFGGSDVFVAKYDPNGFLLWVKHFGGTFDDQGVSVVVDPTDNVLVLVQFQSTNADFGGIFLSAAGNSQDMAIVKLRSDGSTIWAKNWGSTDVEIPLSIACDSSGNAWVGGKFSGTTDLGGGSKTAVGAFDIFVAKYAASDGSHIFDRTMGGINSEGANGIAVDQSTGNVIITGAYIGTIDFGGGNRPSSSSGGVTLFMAGYGPTGTYLWDIIAGGDVAGSPDSGLALRCDSVGNLVLTGIFNSWMDFNRDGNNDAPGSGFFVTAFGISGNTKPTLRWAKRSLTSNGEGASLAFNGGHLLVGGRWVGIINLDGTSATSPAATACPLVAKYVL